MKKLMAILVALTMIMGISAAMAAAPSAEDVSTVFINGEGDIYIVWTDDPDVGDDAESPAGEVKDAYQSGSPLDVLPAEIRAQLPEGYTVVNEVRSAKFAGNLDKLAELNELKAEFKFDTPYDEGEIVYLAIGVAAGEDTEWFLLESVGNAEHNLEVTFDRAALTKIGENSFVVMAISKAK